MVLYTDKNRRYFKIQLIIFMCEVKNVNDIGRSLHFIKKYFFLFGCIFRAGDEFPGNGKSFHLIFSFELKVVQQQRQ